MPDMSSDELFIYPIPRQLERGPGGLNLRRGVRLVLPGPVSRSVLVAAQRLVDQVHPGSGRWTIHAGDGRSWPYRRGSVPAVAARIDPTEDLPAGGYRLHICDDGAELVGVDETGLVYALVTLTQLARSAPDQLPTLKVRDWPVIGRRAVMLDQSRDRVNRLESLLQLVEDMAQLKLNELQLYCEHTFGYVDREVVWAGDDGLSPQDFIEVEQFCRDRQIDLVPAMNSLGHMHKWLEHPEYAALAENYPYRSLPEMRLAMVGERTPLWGEVPFALCAVDPASSQLVEDLMDELLPHFGSAFVNPNLDEPFDLGLGRSRQAVAGKGRAWVYLDYLKAQNDRVRARGLTMMFGADVTWSDPEIIAELPKDAITLDWGYCADFPYFEHAKVFEEAGQPFYVLTGTNSWETIVGATDDMIEHHRLAALALEKHGGLGLMVTDWGWYDYGTIQQFILSYPGIVAAAGQGWSPGQASAATVSAALSRFVFHERDADVLAGLLFELGTLTTRIGLAVSDIGGVRATVRSPLFQVLRGNLEEARQALAAVGTDRPALVETLAELDRLEHVAARTDSSRTDRGALVAELEFTIRLARHSCRRALLALDQPTAPDQLCDELRREVPVLIRDFTECWSRRYRLANLWQTVERFERMRADYLDPTRGSAAASGKSP